MSVLGRPCAGVELRDATISDAPAIADLLAELGHPLDVAAVRGNLERIATRGPDAFTVVALHDGRIAGVVSGVAAPFLHRPSPEGRVTALVVSKAYEGRGIGSSLLRAAEERLAACGCGRIEITSAEHRIDAHRFYLGRGYRAQGVRFVRETGRE